MDDKINRMKQLLEGSYLGSVSDFGKYCRELVQQMIDGKITKDQLETILNEVGEDPNWTQEVITSWTEELTNGTN